MPNMYTRVSNRKDTNEYWSQFNPTLLDGEVILVVVDGSIRAKIGDGKTNYVNLPYATEDIRQLLDTKVSATLSAEDAGKVLGIDATGKVVPVDALSDEVTWGELISSTEESNATFTEHLKLKKPGLSDRIDINDLNSNFDTIDALDGRVSNLLKELTDNPDYAATAEVVDIREGHDGVTYDTAGDAVRALGREIDVIKDNMQNINPDDLGLEQDSATGYVYPTFKGVRSLNGIPLQGGVGGGGGSASTTVFKLRSTTESMAFTVALGAPTSVSYSFSSVDIDDGTPTGNGTASYYLNDHLITNETIPQGEIVFDCSKYIKKGTNILRVTVTDTDGNTKPLIWTITCTEISLASKFDYTLPYEGSVTFKYTAYGDAEKTIHFILDGTEVATEIINSSGKQDTKVFSGLEHGLHTLDVYAEATINGSKVASNHLDYDIMVIKEGSVTPIITINNDVKEVLQGELVQLPWIAYDPLATESTVALEISYLEDGAYVNYKSELRTVDRSLQSWDTRDYPVGNVKFTITLRDISRSTIIKVKEYSLPIYPTTNDLELHLTSANRSNSEVDPAVWSYNDINTIFNNVNWVSSGWLPDANGDTALHLAGGSTASINFKPFSKDLRVYGKTLEFEFAVRDVNNRDANVISCKSGNIGIEIKADHATLYSKLSSVGCNFREERKLRVTFVIESRSEYRMMSVYLDGVLTSVKQYVETDNFQQDNPVEILVGSPYCAVDLYTVRSYSTALTQDEIINNYICDIADITTKTEVFNRNDLYDDARNLLYEKVKTKIPVMTITGPLPKQKDDKKDVTITYEDPNDITMNFADLYCKIDVQGTSSQWYVRKNWKLKFKEYINHIKGAIPSKVFCMKADYAEATSTHNTQNANLAPTLYSDKTPAQEVDPRCRTTIQGFPCVIYHKETESSTPVFLGKYNFNYDKGSEEVFGFTSDFDVESWEFCNNTSDACNFLGNIPSAYKMSDANGNEIGWVNDFERRYPDHDGIEKDDVIVGDPEAAIARFRAMHDWVVASANFNLTKPSEPERPIEPTKPTDESADNYQELLDRYNADYAEYLEALEEYNVALNEYTSSEEYIKYTTDFSTYRTEFEERFNLHKSLIYYIYTFVMLMVDQRAKNMFLTYWAKTGKWEPWLYDNDTCLGINNEGDLVFDYYHEDIDLMSDGSKVYNGQNSVLWNQFRLAYANEIASTYRDLRSTGKLSYEVIRDYFVTGGSDKWSESMYNEDSDYKYLSMLRSDNDATNLDQVKGTGEHQLEYFVSGRIDYCDSKWYASEYADDIVVLRVNTPTTEVNVAPNANITITPFSNMYAGVRYRANGTLQQKRLAAGETHTFIAPADNFNDTETAIYGASKLSSIGDLSPMYCNYCDVSKASKLIELKLGSEDSTYESRLDTLSLGTNRLLKKLDIRNCKKLTNPVNLKGCPSIEEVYAEGSSISSLELADSGYLKIVHLPATVSTLTIKNQNYIEDFTMESYENITELNVEGSPNLPIADILNNTPKLARVRLDKVEWSCSKQELSDLYNKLLNCGGIDETGANIDKAAVSGLVNVPEIDQELLEAINTNFPELMVSVNGVILCTVSYFNYDGSLLYVTTVEQGKNAVDIVAEGIIETPVRETTLDHKYTYKGWSDSLENIQKSRSFVAMYDELYGVRFYAGENLVYNTYVEYGTSVKDPITSPGIDTPTKESSAQFDYTFSHWDNDLSVIAGVTDIHAVFIETIRSYTISFCNEDKALYQIVLEYGKLPEYVGETPAKLNVKYPQDYEFLGWTPEIVAVEGTTEYQALFSESSHITDDWSVITENVANGTYLEKYPIKSLGRLTLTDSDGQVQELEVEIIGHDHDETADGKTAGLTFLAKGTLAETHMMSNSQVLNRASWRDSDMRDFFINVIKPMLPESLAKAIVPVVKKTSAGGGSTSTDEMISTVDELWVPALIELVDDYKSTEVYAAEGKTYEYYVSGPDVLVNKEKRIKYNPSGSSQKYWTRTPVYSNGSSYWMISALGGTISTQASYSAQGVVFGFCIGITPEE